MKSETVSAVKSNLEEIRARLQSFREGGKGRRIPEELWNEAARLCEDLSVNRVSKTLGLNYMDLRRRVKGVEPKPRTDLSPRFLELDLKEASGRRCVVKIERGDGVKLRIEGEIDPLEIVRLFWSGNR